jgi:H+/gluconate symporter-like permease
MPAPTAYAGPGLADATLITVLIGGVIAIFKQMTPAVLSIAKSSQEAKIKAEGDNRAAEIANEQAYAQSTQKLLEKFAVTSNDSNIAMIELLTNKVTVTLDSVTTHLQDITNHSRVITETQQKIADMQNSMLEVLASLSQAINNRLLSERPDDR